MKITKNIKSVFTRSSLLAGLMLLLLPQVATAATVNMELTPSKTQVVRGTTFTVIVKLNLGSNSTYDALARLNYDASKLKFESASYAVSSAWGTPGDDAGLGNGFYTTDVYVNLSEDKQSGSLSLVTVTFSALASSGSTNLSLSNISVSDGDNPPTEEHTVNATGTTISFSPEPTPPSTPPSASTGQNISNDKNNNSGAPTEEDIVVNSAISDDQPVPVSSVIDSQGYDIEITTINEDGEPIPGETVTLGEQVTTTDESGIATFTNVLKGMYTIRALGQELMIEVKTGEPLSPQEFTIQAKDKGLEFGKYLPIVAGLAVLALLAGAGYVFMTKRRGNGPASFTGGNTNGTTASSLSSAPESSAAEPTPNLDDKKHEEYLKPNPPAPETVIEPKDSGEK